MKTKTMEAFASDIGKVSGSLNESWSMAFHISRNLHKYADDPKFEEMVELVKKYESKIYDLLFEFDDDFVKLLKS